VAVWSRISWLAPKNSLGERFFHWHAKPQPYSYPAVRLVVNSTPFGEADFAAFVWNFDRSSFISGLCKNVSPPAIARFVIFIVVDAINRCSRRSRPHVGEKRFKRVNPSLANGNPATTVPFVRCGPWIKAAGFNLSPRPIFFRWRFVCRSAVRFEHRSSVVGPKATTTLDQPSAEKGKRGLNFLAAVTSASNVAHLFARGRLRNDGKSSEFFTNVILNVLHQPMLRAA
jgi:hypothetical protein